MESMGEMLFLDLAFDVGADLPLAALGDAEGLAFCGRAEAPEDAEEADDDDDGAAAEEVGADAAEEVGAAVVVALTCSVSSLLVMGRTLSALNGDDFSSSGSVSSGVASTASTCRITAVWLSALSAEASIRACRTCSISAALAKRL